MKAILLSNPVEVHSRLQELGLTEEILRQIVEAGERARRVCTDNHPRTTPGYTRWSEMVKVSRDLLMPLGWTKRDDGGVPLVVHPEGSIAIAVTTGDEGTGDDSSIDLRLKNRKGAATTVLVEQNAEQLELFDLGSTGVKAKPGVPITWYLIVRRIDGKLRYELSLPLSMIDGQIEKCQERLIFPPIDLDPTLEPIIPTLESTDDIIVKVTPKF